jgi:DNA-directed RNA polymerase subunit RPC12/RpoP
MEKKKKSKVAEFFEKVGYSLYVIWMLIWMLPILIYEEIEELCEKRRKAKEPKPEPVKFVCSECGETFTIENDAKDFQMRGTDGEEYSCLKPIECPKCHGMRTSPEGADISVYEKIWDMDELWSFIQDMKQDWDYRCSTVDKGMIEYRCTECGTVFKARDIGHTSWQYPSRSPNPFPSRCPNCHQMKTLPIDEKNIETYKPLWTMLELAEQTKEARESKKLLEKVAFVF